jgi:hypothetical protein
MIGTTKLSTRGENAQRVKVQEYFSLRRLAEGCVNRGSHTYNVVLQLGKAAAAKAHTKSFLAQTYAVHAGSAAAVLHNSPECEVSLSLCCSCSLSAGKLGATSA